jgi:heptosyltransferase-1
MKRILLVKTSSMGDVIHNLPVVNDILQHLPDAQIDWVVEESFAEIPRLHPKINQVFTVAMRCWRKHIFSKNTWRELQQCKRLLSQQPYDFIIDTQGLIKSAIIATWANGTRYGYDKSSIREPYASYFYQQKYAISYQHHAVFRNRTLAAMSLDYAVPTGAPNYGIAMHKVLSSEVQALNFVDHFFVALHGTSKESKLWPEEYWIQLGQQLAARELAMLLPWSNQAEFERAKRIAEKVNAAIVLPTLSITSLSRIIAQAKIAIGVDTGLSHLAAALDIPTIALYTDSNPLLTGVMAGNKVPAVNLGGKGNVPSMEDVLEQVNIFQT